MKRIVLSLAVVALILAAHAGAGAGLGLPSSFDLRYYDGENYVTSVKTQLGGTCWAHGAVAAMESNMMMTGVWESAGESGQPDLAEYHIDWWNGFNNFYNEDIDPPDGAGIQVHQGGNFHITTAYLSRGEGAVRNVDAQVYQLPPDRSDPDYHYFYVRDVEWYVAGPNLENICDIKQAIVKHGAVGTCLCYSSSFMSSDFVHYQWPESTLEPNHIVAIVGWNDDMSTEAGRPGAWLCKNSWGASWGMQGYFWISYYDKHCGHDTGAGAVSMRNIEPMQYDHIYFHDYHGWRDTKTDCREAMNAFVAAGSEMLRSVSFYTAADGVDYTVSVYKSFENRSTGLEVSYEHGFLERTGFHTIDLGTPVLLSEGEEFYVRVILSDGGHAYDKTSGEWIRFGGNYRSVVESSASPAESFYRMGFDPTWYDLYELDPSANFCIKALTYEVPTGVGEVAAAAGRLRIDAVYPNPANPEASVRFTLPRACGVRLAVYDVSGRRVATLVDEVRAAGEHTVEWLGRDDSGRSVASGVYFVRLVANEKSATRKVTLLK
ncbi:MAG: T9SS type A sorting domain-containing protein [Candidatus Eisenbacteria bacterium]|nr:T9SS type A sorting domain-containing protein [Candidatus Eisenbacteria bacterium]